MMGRIARIQRFSTTNGPGLRSTVFLKGCPLRCQWCHNPEMQSTSSELMVYTKVCTACGGCQKACDQDVHSIIFGIHAVDRSRCVRCGKCMERCPNRAIELIGMEVDANEVVERLLRDKIFYDAGKGGVTLSGGEPLMQYDFTREILTLCKAQGLHTCVDTSGWGGRAQELAGLVDLFLWDIKETDAQRHLMATGAHLPPILESLGKVDAAGGVVHLRCPIIPGVNARREHVQAIGSIANQWSCIKRIDLVPYHKLGMAKADAISMQQAQFGELTAEGKDELFRVLEARCCVPVQWI